MKESKKNMNIIKMPKLQCLGQNDKGEYVRPTRIYYARQDIRQRNVRELYQTSYRLFLKFLSHTDKSKFLVKITQLIRAKHKE